MSVVLDYTSRIDPTALKAAGAIGVNRYLSFLPNPKVILQSEYNELVTSGIEVTLNWEFRGLDWMGGALDGSRHGIEAVRQATALGYPKGKVIVGSADFDMTLAQWGNAGRAYAEAYAVAILAGGYRPGVYGPWDVLQWVKNSGFMDAFWQSMSTAHSGGRNAKPWPGAHLWQRAHLTVGGTDTDYSDILIMPLWGTQGRGKDVLRVATVTQTGAATNYYIGDGIWYVNAVTWAEVQQANAEGAVNKSFDVSGDWKGHVGRNLAGSVGGTLTVTQEQLNAAVAANVAGLASALASHFKVV